jgi:methylated-DNA-[protein]-cysteine S-methyltransferase
MIALRTAHFDSPIGSLTLVARDGRLCALTFEDDAALARRLARRLGEVAFQEADDPAGGVTALRAYFAGDLDALDRLDVDPGGTPFQSRVWQALRTIPAGRTMSYGELARAVGSPRAARAVGAANHDNPIALVVPCHRAIGADRRLVGYAGGLDRKRWLLAHEGALLA